MPDTTAQPKRSLLVGCDQFTLNLKVKNFRDYLDWQAKVNSAIQDFLNRTELDRYLGAFVFTEDGRKLMNGYTQGYTVADAPYAVSISYNQDHPVMGICVHLSAFAWNAYQTNYHAANRKAINISGFLCRARSDEYDVSMTRIDVFADYLNYPSIYSSEGYLTTDELYRSLLAGKAAVVDRLGRKLVRTKKSVDEDGTYRTISIGSKKKNTNAFMRIYDKKAEQEQKGGFQIALAQSCESWIRFEAVYRHKYANQIMSMLTD